MSISPNLVDATWAACELNVNVRTVGKLVERGYLVVAERGKWHKPWFDRADIERLSREGWPDRRTADADEQERRERKRASVRLAMRRLRAVRRGQAA